MTPFIAEIIGTAILILLGNGVVANVVLKDTKGNNSGWIVITTAWAFAVFAGVTIAGPISGAHLNPAVTIGLATAGLFPWESVPTYLAGEMIGAMIGAFLVWLFYKDHFKITEDEGGKLACFSTGPAIRNTFSNFRTYRNLCIGICRILYCRSIFFNRSNRRRKNRIRLYRSITCFYYRLGNWFSIRWNYWICNKPCKRFRT